MKELVKPIKLEKQWKSTELYNECGYNNCGIYNGKTNCQYNDCGTYNSSTEVDDILF